MMPEYRISPENPKKVFDIIVELLVYVDEETQKDVADRWIVSVMTVWVVIIVVISSVNIAGLLN